MGDTTVCRFPRGLEFQKPRNLSSNMLVPGDMWGPLHIQWEAADIGYFFESKGFVKNMWRDGLRNTPFSDKERLDFMTAELGLVAPRVFQGKTMRRAERYSSFTILRRRARAGQRTPIRRAPGCRQRARSTARSWEPELPEQRYAVYEEVGP
jgi:hypothetical protein